MKATETQLLKFLQGTRQFIIPIYQRTYSWTNTQCQQLWNDILRVGQDENIPGHFVGSVVYIESGLYQISAVPQVLVIDGQQRLTTITLLLAALGRVLEEHNPTEEISRKKIENYYLFNAEEEGKLRYKLLLTQSDKETLLHRISDHLPTPDKESHRIKENYDFFSQQLHKDGVDPLAIYAGLRKLFIVDVSLDRNYDNPQLIFESLNSTGLELSQADLIRNYVLMGLEINEQTRLYNTYWYPMEQRLSRVESIPMFDRFMRDYLTIKSSTGAIPNIGDVYRSFKAYRSDNDHKDTPISEIVADIYRFAQHFIHLAYADDPDREISAVLDDINTLKVDVAYPLLMEAYDDYSIGVLSRDDFLAILRLVESYVFRRSVCGIPTSSLNKTFAQIRHTIDKSRYREWMEEQFAGLASYRRFPNDEEFKAAFAVKDMYNYRSRNYLLRKLENAGRKEPVKVEEYTIEHVMPQNDNLSTAWQAELGSDWQSVHTNYLHRIGNLTLTGYNSELSDRPFAEKRAIPGGFDESPLRLNRSIAHLEHWNAEEIERRGRELAEKAVTIWQAPPQRTNVHATSQQLNGGARTYTFAETNYGAYLQGDVLTLFEQLRKRIMNLDSSVREEIKGYYVAYKTSTNFVDVTPQKQRLRLTLNMRFGDIDDPRGVCNNITNLGRWGNGDVEIILTASNELEYTMYLIEQAFEAQREDVE